ncbi:phasin family protein [Pistricoccus aurantiacus]|uniref:Phasin family protein n=1 Tax=Pistricoccus aurantiacus TaxID=1883414 RepID=A0A5B8SU72_9GAMM|nr:phasin family protein [Pistricoccus aurantiacus]QEA40732.1 phasin family protein [Pistricoccus aurantiacus]
MANTDIKANYEKANQQFESVFFGPARAYANMMLDYTEKLANAQQEALRVYSELGFQQARAALQVKNAEDLRSYVEEQQKAAKEAGEQMKTDAEKVVSISKDFMQQSQELTQDSMKRGQEVAQENMQKGQQQAQEAMQRGEQQVEDSAKNVKASSKK